MYYICLHTSPRSCGSPYWSLYRPLKCWLKTKRPPDISLAKVSLFGMSRDFHCGVSNHVKPHASSCMIREGVLFYQGKVRWEVIVTKSPWLFIGWIFAWKEEESFFFLLGFCYHHSVRIAHAGHQIPFGWGFCLLIFIILYNNKYFSYLYAKSIIML